MWSIAIRWFTKADLIKITSRKNVAADFMNNIERYKNNGNINKNVIIDFCDSP